MTTSSFFRSSTAVILEWHALSRMMSTSTSSSMFASCTWHADVVPNDPRHGNVTDNHHRICRGAIENVTPSLFGYDLEACVDRVARHLHVRGGTCVLCLCSAFAPLASDSSIARLHLAQPEKTTFARCKKFNGDFLTRFLRNVSYSVPNKRERKGWSI